MVIRQSLIAEFYSATVKKCAKTCIYAIFVVSLHANSKNYDKKIHQGGFSVMRSKSKFVNVLSIAAGCVFLLLAVSCSSMKDNSDRSLQELASHMISRVDGVVDGKVFTVPVKAIDGICIRVSGREVFLYQYDLSIKKQKKIFKGNI